MDYPDSQRYGAYARLAEQEGTSVNFLANREPPALKFSLRKFSYADHLEDSRFF